MNEETRKLIMEILHKYNENVGGELHTKLLKIFNAGIDFGYQTVLEYERL